jgi:hypothetical protein
MLKRVLAGCFGFFNLTNRKERAMKVITEVKEGEGLESLLGEQVLIICAVYIYSGKLVGVNQTCIKLEDASIVYETGEWGKKGYTDAQKLPNKYHYVSTGMIESFNQGK